MTEPIPPDPTDDATWFRSQVDPVLDAEPIADAWPAVAARAGGAPVPHRSSPRSRTWLAAAAVLVALVALAGVLAATRSGDDGSAKVQTAPPTTVPGDPQETGWYAPVGLPEGWKVQQVLATPGRGRVCEASGATWTIDGSATVGVTYDTCAFPQNKNTRRGYETTDLDGGILGTGPRMEAVPSDDPRTEMRWDDDGGGWFIQATGISPDDMVALSNALIADPDRDDLPVPGLELLERWERPAGENPPNVVMWVDAPSGKRANVSLVLPGHGRTPDGGLLVTPAPIDGQPLPVVRFDSPDDGMWSSERYRGRWPGADVLIERHVPAGQFTGDAISDADLEVLIASLKPRTTEEWRAFLATPAFVTEGLSDAATLAEAGAVPLGDLVPPSTTTTTTSTMTAPTTTSTTVAPRGQHDQVVVSEPGVDTPLAEPNPQLRPLDGLDARLELPDASLSVPVPTMGTLILRNLSDRALVINECSQLSMRWGVVPVDDPEQELPFVPFIDCFDTEVVRIDPGQTERLPLDWSIETGFAARRFTSEGLPRGTLAGGPYLAVVEIPGRNETIRITLPVAVEAPPCTTTDADVARYLGRSAAEAADLARAAGDTSRTVERPQERPFDPTAIDCGRVNLTVDNDADRTVVDALRY